jgi:hypothetical protein
MKLPRIVPLTLTRQREPFDHPDWIFESKHARFAARQYVQEFQAAKRGTWKAASQGRDSRRRGRLP